MAMHQSFSSQKLEILLVVHLDETHTPYHTKLNQTPRKYKENAKNVAKNFKLKK